MSAVASKSWLGVLAVLLILGCTAGCVEPPTGEFAIYLTAKDLSVQEVGELDLQQIELQSRPIVSSADILSYLKDSHEMMLTEEGAQRVEHVETTTLGRPFVVCVGEERVYSGAFWPMWSSASYDGIVIEVPLMNRQTVQLRRGYPSADQFRGPDPRSDPRILRALRQSGKTR